MHRLTATTPVLAAAALLSGSAFAHHSMSMYDMSNIDMLWWANAEPLSNAAATTGVVAVRRCIGRPPNGNQTE